MLALKVEKALAEKAKELLREKNLLAKGIGAVRDSKHVYFPVTKKAKISFGTFVNRRFKQVPRAQTLKESLKGKLTPSQIRQLVSSYDSLGSIAIIDVPKALEKIEKTIARALLETNRKIKTVLKKASAMKGEYRTREFVWLAGEKNYFAEYKEGGCLFRFDVRSAYFSPRLSFERLRIAQKVRPGERVLALFAGVGPYAIIIAKKQPLCRVKAIELNPDAFNAMVENVKLNKATNVEPILGDVRGLIPSAWADRAAMPLPHTGEDFLDVVSDAMRDGGVVHFYAFGGQKEGVFKRALEAIKKACKEKNVSYEILEKRIVRPYAPYVFQVVVDFRIRSTVK